MKGSKAAAKLARRRRNFDATLDGKDGYKRPGSMNNHKSAPAGKR